VSIHSLDMVTTIVVRVGGPAEQRDFTILHSIATKSSKFTQKTSSGDWNESHEGRTSLPETKLADFEVYLEWLYTGHVVTLDGYRSLGPTLIRLYVFGDFLSDDRFSNAVIEALILKSHRGYPWLTFSLADIDFGWDKTMPGCRLRKLLVDFVIRDLSADITSPCFMDKSSWCSEVTAEVFARMANSKQIAVEMFARDRNPKRMDLAIQSAVEHLKDNKNKCADYHKHGEGHPACT
jgi:hypothetical protein